MSIPTLETSLFLSGANFTPCATALGKGFESKEDPVTASPLLASGMRSKGSFKSNDGFVAIVRFCFCLMYHS